MELAPFTPDAKTLEHLRVKERHLFVAEPDEPVELGKAAFRDDAHVAEHIALKARTSLVGLLRKDPKASPAATSFTGDFASMLAQDLSVSANAANYLARLIAKRLTASVMAELEAVLQRPRLPSRAPAAAFKDSTAKTRARVQELIRKNRGEKASGGSAR